jgi:hypothetical protein
MKKYLGIYGLILLLVASFAFAQGPGIGPGWIDSSGAIFSPAVVNPGHKHSESWASDGSPLTKSTDQIGNVFYGPVDITASTSLSGTITAIGSTAGELSLAQTSQTGGGLTIPATLQLKAPKGSTITIATGTTFTINGPFEAGPYQVFSCTGTGAVSFAAGTIPAVRMDWFGSDETAFAKATAATPTNGKMVMSGKAYTFTTAVTFDKIASLWMEEGGYISSSVTGVALTIPHGDSGKYRLDVRRSSADWTSGNVAIEIGDMNNCEVYVEQVKGFEKGLYLHNTTATTGIIAYNKFFLNWVWNNKSGVYLHSEGSGTVSANRFFGGRFAVSTGVVVGTARQGIVTNGAGTNYVMNNAFYGPVIEIDASDGTSTSTALQCLGNSDNNRIIGEGYIEDANVLLDAQGNARYNSVEGLLGETSSTALPESRVSDTSNFPGTNTVKWSLVNNYHISGTKAVFPNSDIHSKTLVNSFFGGGTYLTIPGYCFLSSGGYTFNSGSAEHFKNYINIPGTIAVGRAIDTSIVKDFWVDHSRFSDYSSGAYPLIIIKCYDANGVALTGTSPYYVLGSSRNMDTHYSVAQTSDFGTSYYINGSYSRVFLRFNAAVKMAWIGITSHSGSLKLPVSSFQVLCSAEASTPASWPGYVTATSTAYATRITSPIGGFVCNVSPLGGLLATGDQVQNLAAASGQAPGWATVGRVTTAANGGEPAGEVNLAVDDITGITNGDILGVLLDNEQWHWTSVNGVPAAGVVVMTAGVPVGRTIPDDAPVITYRLLALPALP